MAHKSGPEAVNTMLQDLRGYFSTNGGVLGIYVGDFRQTLPVVPRGKPADEINACLKSSRLWRNTIIMRLHTNMQVRLAGDPSATQF